MQYSTIDQLNTVYINAAQMTLYRYAYNLKQADKISSTNLKKLINYGLDEIDKGNLKPSDDELDYWLNKATEA